LVKLFISRTDAMSKVVIRVGHKELVVTPAAALAVIDAISGAEVYEAKWRRGEGAGDSYYTHHVYPQSFTDKMSFEVITDELYRMAKMAGAPVEK
jgi:hypothetical protein